MASSSLCLASASPRRRALLRQIGLEPLVLPSGLDERLLEGEIPGEAVRRLAGLKAREVAGRLPATAEGVRLVIGADTEVALDGEVLGKPRDAADAAAMLRRLSGRVHEVWTGVHLVRLDDGRESGGAERTLVRFRELHQAAIDRYVAGGEPLDKAGAYGIQGSGVLLTDGIDGSWSNVVGLPLERLPDWIAAVGVELDELLVGTDRER